MSIRCPAVRPQCHGLWMSLDVTVSSLASSPRSFCRSFYYLIPLRSPSHPPTFWLINDRILFFTVPETGKSEVVVSGCQYGRVLVRAHDAVIYKEHMRLVFVSFWQRSQNLWPFLSDETGKGAKIPTASPFRALPSSR